MKAVTHLEKVIAGETSAVTHLEKVISQETAAVTYTEKVIAGEAPPITHLQKVIAGEARPVTHLEYVWAGGSPPSVQEYTGAVPVTFVADGTPLLDYIISGNTVQNGTPTPDIPIMPQGTGERTGNLFNYTITQGSFAIETGNEQSSPYRVRTNIPDFLLPAGTYTVNVDGADDIVIYCYDDNGYVQSASFTGWAPTPRTFTLSSSLYVRFAFRFGNNATISPSDIENVMLNSGSTALPYEPYGYKIQISSANTTTPVYLGEVETTRKIKKLVLDGTEDLNEGTSNYYIFINVSGRGEGIPNSTALSTHTESGVVVNNNGTALFFKKSVFVHSSLADFKSYLQQQYAAGTPVTVWYVLATEETAVVNEPLMKIGDYADTLSYAQAGVSIPTANGSTTLDVETTVKPSEVYIKYRGEAVATLSMLSAEVSSPEAITEEENPEETEEEENGSEDVSLQHKPEAIE